MSTLWLIILALAIFALVLVCVGVLIFIARKSNITSNQSSSVQQIQSPDPAGETGTTPTGNTASTEKKWIDDPKFFVPVGAIGSIIILLLGFWYVIPWILARPIWLQLAGLIILSSVVKKILNFDSANAKKDMISLVNTISTLSIIVFLSYSAWNYIPWDSAEGTTAKVGSKIGSFFTPAPPPEKKWKASKDLVVPANVDWDKALEVKLPWTFSRWNITGLMPDNDGFYEILVPGNNNPFRCGGDTKRRLPDLTSDLTFKIRSAEDHDIKVRLNHD